MADGDLVTFWGGSVTRSIRHTLPKPACGLVHRHLVWFGRQQKSRLL